MSASRPARVRVYARVRTLASASRVDVAMFAMRDFAFRFSRIAHALGFAQSNTRGGKMR